VAIVASLGACGFRPVYGPGLGGEQAAERSAVASRLAAIRVSPLSDRIGQHMHNLLRDRLNPRGQPAEPDYMLDITLGEVRDELGIRKDEIATRANLIVTARYALREVGTERLLLDGSFRSINSYNILENKFATTISEKDARARALRSLSQDIHLRLGAYFAESTERNGQPRS
jgi:LPS-assembly lipoprotein